MYLNEGWIDWPITKTTKPYPEPWQQTLLEAAEAIRTNGWRKKSYGSQRIGFCLLGALFFARHEECAEPDTAPCSIQMTPEGQALAAHLKVSHVHLFNDEKLDNKEDAIVCLEGAANY